MPDSKLCKQPNNYSGVSNNPTVWNKGTGQNPLLQANAYGNVDGGQLWDEIKVNTLGDFPEIVYRLLIKSHFDKGHTSMFYVVT